MEVEEDSSQSGAVETKGSSSHHQQNQKEDEDSQNNQISNNESTYSDIIDSIIAEHKQIQSITDLYDIVLSKVDESQQDSESYEDIDLDELADECFKLLKVKLYDSFAQSMWQDKSLQQSSESQKIEFIDDKLNENFDFFHTVSNLLIYMQQLQKSLVRTSKQQLKSREPSSMQNSSEKENPTEGINLRQRKSAAATPTSSSQNHENKQTTERLRQRNSTALNNNADRKSAAPAVNRNLSKKGGDTLNISNSKNAAQSTQLQQLMINSNESLSAKSQFANNGNPSLQNATDKSTQGEQKIFVRLNPLNVQTQQVQLYLQNFPRLEVKIGINQCLSYLLEYLHRKWLLKPQTNNNGNTFGISIYPDNESWLIEFKGQEKPKLSEQLMINDLYSGFNYPKDQVVNLFYEIIKDQAPQPAPIQQISEWENPIQNTMPSPRLHIPLSPQNLGMDHEYNYHFLQQFSQDSDFRFFNYYDNLFNEDDDEDYVINEDEEEEEEDDDDEEEEDDDDFEEEEEIVEEEQQQNQQKCNPDGEEQQDQGIYENQHQGEKKSKETQNEAKKKKSFEGDDLNYLQNGNYQNPQQTGHSLHQKKKSKLNKEEGFESKKAQIGQSGNKKGQDRKQKHQLHQQQHHLHSNLLNNSYNSYNADINFDVYHNLQQNLLEDCKDTQNTTNFDLNNYTNTGQIGDYYNDQYNKLQMANNNNNNNNNNGFKNPSCDNNGQSMNEQFDNNEIQNPHHSMNVNNSNLKQGNMRTSNLLAGDNLSNLGNNLSNLGNNLSNIVSMSGLESQGFQIGKQLNQQGGYEGYLDYSNTNNNINNMNNNNNTIHNNPNINSINHNNNDGYGNNYSNMNLLNPMHMENSQIGRMQDNQLENEINDKDSISLMINSQQNKQKYASVSQQQIQFSSGQQNGMFPDALASPETLKDKKKSKVLDKQNDKLKRQKQQSTVEQSPDEKIIQLINPKNPFQDQEMFQKIKSKGSVYTNSNLEKTNDNFEKGKIKDNEDSLYKADSTQLDNNDNTMSNIRPPSFQLNQITNNKYPSSKDQSEINKKEPKLSKFIKQNSGVQKASNTDEKHKSNEDSEFIKKINNQDQQQLEGATGNQEKPQQINHNELILTTPDTQKKSQNLKQENQEINEENEEEDEDYEEEEEDDRDEDEEEDDADENDNNRFNKNYDQMKNNSEMKKNAYNNTNNQFSFNEQSQVLLKDTSPLQFKHNFSNFNLFNQDSYHFHNNQSYNFNSINNIFNTSSNAHLQNPIFAQQSNYLNSNLTPKVPIKNPLSASKKKGIANKTLFGDKNSNSDIFHNDNSMMNQNSMIMRFEDPSSNFKPFEFPFSGLHYASNSRPFHNDKNTNMFTMSKFNQNSNLNSIHLFKNNQHSNQLNFLQSQMNNFPLHSRIEPFAEKGLHSDTDKDGQQIPEENALTNREDVFFKNNTSQKSNQHRAYPQINIIKSESSPSLSLNVKHEQEDQTKIEPEEKDSQKQQNQTSITEQKNEISGYRKINVIKKEDSGIQTSLLGRRFNSEQGELKQITKVEQNVLEKLPSQSVINTGKIEDLIKQLTNNQQIEQVNESNQNDSQQQDSFKYLQNESNQEVVGNTSNNNSSNIFKVRKLSANVIQNQNSLNQTGQKVITNNNSNSNFSKTAQEVNNAIANLLSNNTNLINSQINNNNSKNQNELSKGSVNSNNLSNTESKDNFKFLKYQNEFTKYYNETIAKQEESKQNSQSQSLNTLNSQIIKSQPSRIDSTKVVSAILENVIASQALKNTSTSQSQQNASLNKQELNLSLLASTLSSQNNTDKQQSQGSTNLFESLKQMVAEKGFTKTQTEGKSVSPSYQIPSKDALINSSNNNEINLIKPQLNKAISINNNNPIQSVNSQPSSNITNQSSVQRSDLQFIEDLVELVGLKSFQNQGLNNQVLSQGKDLQTNTQNTKQQQQNDNPQNKNILVKSVSVVRKHNSTATPTHQTNNVNINKLEQQNKQNIIDTSLIQASGDSKSQSNKSENALQSSSDNSNNNSINNNNSNNNNNQ